MPKPDVRTALQSLAAAFNHYKGFEGQWNENVR